MTLFVFFLGVVVGLVVGICVTLWVSRKTF